MNAADFNDLNESEKSHFYKCEHCGEMVDKRQLDDVLFHEDHRSPPRNCSHEALPFVEAPAKAKLAGSVETQPSVYLAAFSAFRLADAPIMTARNKDVRCEWVVLCFHCRKLGLNITYRRSQSLQGVLKACRTHDCSTEHIGC